jgi:fibronectin-binding autotransporter adhesin
MRHAATAQGLASLGRNGDTMLMHVSPEEVHGLQALAVRHGKSLTVNPHTGLPEAFDLKSFLPMIAGIALSPFTGGMSMGMALALQAGTGAAIGLATKNKNQSALSAMGLGALGTVGGAGLGGSLIGAGAGSAGAAGTALAPIPEAGLSAAEGTAANTAVTNAALASGGAGSAGAGANMVGQGLASGTGLGGLSGAGTAASGLPEFASTGIDAAVPAASTTQAAVPMSEQWTQGMSQMGRGVGNLNRDQALRSGFMKTLPAGRLTLAAAAAPVLMSASEQTPSTPVNTKPRGYYNTRWDPNKHAYVDPRTGSPVTEGYWTKDYLDAGRAGTLGAGQSSAGAGTYDNPYAGTTTVRGGGMISMASGGTTPAPDTSGLRNYYQGLLAAPQPSATAADSAAMHSWLTNMQGSPTAAVAPPQPRVVPPNASPSTPVGIANPNNPRFTTSANGNSNVANHAFTWDPITQTFTKADTSVGGGIGSSGGVSHAAQGGLASLSDASFAGGKFLRGGGDGMSDSIHANIDGKQQARLARNEFVVPADVVSHLGNGSSEAGAEMLYKMMDRVRQARTGKKSQAPEIDSGKYLPA